LEITLVKREKILYDREKVTYSSTLFGLFISEATKSNAKNMTLVFMPPGVLLKIYAILLHQAGDP
jgi:hypothetical protein